MSIEDKNIPAQNKGNHVDIIARIEPGNRDNAIKLFNVARTRLLDMSNWSKIANGPSSEFQLTDENGNDVTRLAQQGDKLKIDLPGPGSLIGDGNDWVEIKHIQDELDSYADIEVASVMVRPTSNPKSDKDEIAHFFTDDASSTFMIKRTGNVVTAEVHGRNEMPNTQADNVVDSIRHIAVAMGAIFGFSKPQWKHLAEGLLDHQEQARIIK